VNFGKKRAERCASDDRAVVVTTTGKTVALGEPVGCRFRLAVTIRREAGQTSCLSLVPDRLEAYPRGLTQAVDFKSGGEMKGDVARSSKVRRARFMARARAKAAARAVPGTCINSSQILADDLQGEQCRLGVGDRPTRAMIVRP